jgi:biofilm PGA synthesis N-glycosyltransferase PgaC
MDLTWSLYEHGHRVRFVPEAVCYPVEPRNFLMLRRQLRRWSHGFVQNLALHWRGILQIPYLRSAVSVALWDATVSSLAFLLLVPILALFVNPLFLLAYVMDAAALFVPVAAGALARHELGRALVSLPSFFVLRPINGAFFLAALVSELVLRRSLRVYEKGH